MCHFGALPFGVRVGSDAFPGGVTHWEGVTDTSGMLVNLGIRGFRLNYLHDSFRKLYVEVIALAARDSRLRACLCSTDALFSGQA